MMVTRGDAVLFQNSSRRRSPAVIGFCFVVSIVLPSTGCVEVDSGDTKPIRAYDADFVRLSLPDSMLSDSFYMINLVLKNIGSENWNSGGEYPVRLSYHWFKEGDLVLLDGYRTELPSDVSPGETLTININIKTPSEPGRYSLVIDPVKEGVTWFEAGGSQPLIANITIEEIPNADTKPIRAYDADFVDLFLPDLMFADSFYVINLGLKNIGLGDWNRGGESPVHLSYHWFKEEGDLVLLDGYRTELPSDVSPGETLTININIKTPSEPGRYSLVIDPVKEGVTWFEAGGSQPLIANITVEETPITFIDGLDYASEYSVINELEELIQNTLKSSAISFDGRSGRVYGFFAGSGYPQIWVRDSATIIPTARYFYEDRLITTWIEEFLIDQAENGSVYDFVSPMGLDKNTVETDQETSLVHSAYQYYRISGDEGWLRKDVNGKEIILRLDESLRYLLNNKYNSTYGLIEGAYTADWGDVQFEDSPGTDITDHSHMTCDIYDNSMFYRACEELSFMYSALGDEENATFWSKTAKTIRYNTNRYLWQEDEGFYKMHVSSFNFGFSEEDMFPMGGNAMAVRSGLANHTQASKIFKTVTERKQLINSTTIGCVLHPPYSEGFFVNPIMDEEYEYQNGGQWDWFAGRLILAEFENGFSEDAVSHLAEISDQNVKSRGLYEWYNLAGEGRGSQNYAGSAGVLGEAIIEGYFGVYLSHDDLEIKPRLGGHNGSISLFEPVTGAEAFYNYSVLQNETIILDYNSNIQTSYNISILIPRGKFASNVMLDDVSIQSENFNIGDDKYVSFVSDPGHHRSAIELASD